MPGLSVDGADVNGDGLMDVVFGVGSGESTVFVNDGEGGWVTGMVVPGGVSARFLDANGDGAADLWYQTWAAQDDALDVGWLLSSEGGRLPMSAEATGLTPPADDMEATWLTVQHLEGGAVDGFLWRHWPEWIGPGYGVSYLSANHEMVQAHLATQVRFTEFHYVGDFDLDGDVDVVSTGSRIFDPGMNFPYSDGLFLLINQGDGTLDRHAWFQDAKVRDDVVFTHLNGDEYLDAVLVDSDPREPGVVVCLGGPDGTLVQEGRYPIAGYGFEVLTGDVDGDGDTDLVVLEPEGYGTGGVHVLLSRVSQQTTAVTGPEAAPTPAALWLGACYPNPFNPSVQIPVRIGAASHGASVRIYDVLGQRVRVLADGALGAGEHLLTWDGHDDDGRSVAAGVYVCRLEVGDQVVTRKVVKVE
jgi:hypothetical protein